MAANNDWLAVLSNLYQARLVWKIMTRILSKEVADPRVSGFFFKAMVQVVLLFGSETWVVTPHMGRSHWEFPGPVGKTADGAYPTA